MAIYTTLFTATDSELTELFPGWRLPLPAPAPRQETRKNPFAGQAEDITIVTWDPGSPVPRGELPSLYEGIDRPLLPPVLPPDGEFLDYQQWLEDCCPTVLRTLPHVAMKGITHYELQELGAVLVGDNVPPGRFVDCPEDEGFIGAIQAQAIPLLAKASRKQLHATPQSGAPGSKKGRETPWCGSSCGCEPWRVMQSPGRPTCFRIRGCDFVSGLTFRPPR